MSPAPLKIGFRVTSHGRHVRTPICALAGTIVSILGSRGSAARAAELRIHAPEACAEVSAVSEQVEGLLGRALTTVEGVDFEVEIVEGPHQKWKLRVDTIDNSEHRRRTRELSGRNCAELIDAAAIAIAMSIRSSAGGTEAPEPVPTVSPDPLPKPRVPAIEGIAGEATPEPLRVSMALAMLADAGALPRVALGIGIEVSLHLRRLRLTALGALFPSQITRTDGVTGVGGDFQLALGGILACLTQRLDQFSVLGCGGGEIGLLSAQGVGVNTPRLGGALWSAGRAEVGGTWSLGPSLALALRGGVTLPVLRPTFVVDGTTLVHQPSSVTTRATLGIELGF